MYLLFEGVRWERDIEAIGAGHTPDGDDDVGVLVFSVVASARRAIRAGEDRRAAKVEKGLGLGLRADLAEDFCQQLLSGHEVLGGPANTEGNLLDGGVAPSDGKGVVADLGGQGGGVVAERDDDVLEAVTGRNDKRARSRRLAGEVVREPGVILHGDCLNLTVVGVRVVKVFHFAEVRKCSRSLSRHLYLYLVK